MAEMPKRIWAWEFMPEKQDDVIKGGWDDKLDRKATGYIRSDCAAPQWQPIETAPKDGKPIVAVHHRYYSDWHVVWWQPEFEDFISSCREMTMAPGYTINGKTRELHSPVTHSLTHWMPLPEPPDA